MFAEAEAAWLCPPIESKGGKPPGTVLAELDFLEELLVPVM
jgi:hypothetical protein